MSKNLINFAPYYPYTVPWAEGTSAESSFGKMFLYNRVRPLVVEGRIKFFSTQHARFMERRQRGCGEKFRFLRDFRLLHGNGQRGAGQLVIYIYI